MIFILCVSILISVVGLSHVLSFGHICIRSLYALMLVLPVYGLFYFIFLVLKLPFYYFLSLILILSILISWLAFKKLDRRIQMKEWNFKRYLPFILLVLIVNILFFDKCYHYGGWDAIAIWELHGKYLTLENQWILLFSDDLDWSHPDYPLYYPLILAFFWKSLNEWSPIVPMLYNYVIFLGFFIVFYFGRLSFHGQLIGLLFCIFLGSDVNFISIVSSQLADSTLSFTILLSIYLFLEINDNQTNAFILLGIISSSSFWVKNEGVVFFLVFSLAIVIFSGFTKAQKFKYFIGAIPLLIVLILFKISIPISNDITSSVGTDSFAKFMSFDRYLIIFKGLINILVTKYFYIILIVTMLFFTKPKSQIILVLAVLASILVGYRVVYLITPNDLEWHINTSINRLIHQLYPSLLLCACYTLQSSDLSQFKIISSNSKDNE